MPFVHQLPLTDRREAGRLLAGELGFLSHEPDLLVLGLPRGGVPVAFEVAQALRAPLDVLVVRKIGMPGHPEYALGAIASGGFQVLADPAQLPGVRTLLKSVVQREDAELHRRERAYRGDKPPASLAGRTVVLVDDGIATGATMEVAARAVRAQRPHRLVLAAPVASVEAVQRLALVADQVVVGAAPEPFDSVSLWYQHFPECRDDEVQQLLAAASMPQTGAA